MDVPEVTPEIRALLKREADEIVRELFEEQPDIDRDKAAEIAADELKDRVLLYHQIEAATR